MKLLWKSPREKNLKLTISVLSPAQDFIGVFFIQFVKNVIETLIFNKEVKNTDTNVGEVKQP